MADRGEANAQAKLGYLYSEGKGVAKDATEAVRWYRKAADQGNASARYYLGYHYYEGQGVAQNATEAARWFRTAADQNDASAQAKLGYLYSEGKGVAKDATEAVRWYRKAADQGNASARYYLGYHYYEGQGVAQNATEAARWFRTAADQNDASAQTMLGYLYSEGEGVAQNATEAVRWYRKAADQGNAFARDRLADLELKPISTVPYANTELQKPAQESIAVAFTAPQVSPLPSSATRRALVIGNAAYGDQYLRNPVRDGNDPLKRRGGVHTIRLRSLSRNAGTHESMHPVHAVEHTCISIKSSVKDRMGNKSGN